MNRDLRVHDHWGYAVREACPCCAAPVSGAREVMHSDPRAESIPPEEHGKFLSGYDARRVFFSYVRCESCQLLYCPTYYSPGQLERLYGHQSENMAELPLSARIRTQADYVQVVDPRTAPEGDYLELGADIGLCAKFCAERKRFNHYWLYEPNRDVQSELSQRLSGVPYTVRTHDFSTHDVPPDTISLAVGIHVLDHVWEPVRMLRAIRDAMRPGGRILIVTHDERSLLARVLGRRFPPYTLQHPQLFSAASLRRTATEAGLEVTRIIKTVNYFPLWFLVEAALRVVGLRSYAGPKWPAAQVGLRLGNVALVAEKH
jgi:SAM-dependent methyltransferase